MCPPEDGRHQFFQPRCSAGLLLVPGAAVWRIVVFFPRHRYRVTMEIDHSIRAGRPYAIDLRISAAGYSRQQASRS